MTETPPPEVWLLNTAAIPYWAIALLLLLAIVIFAIFNVQAAQPTSNPSIIQKRFGLITWTRRTAHFIIGLWGCALALLMGAFFLTAFQLLQEILATSNQDVIRQLAIALPAVAAASAGLIALPITLNRLQLTNRQTQAEEEGLITDRINAAVLGLGAEKTVKVTEDGQVVERTEPNIEVRIGSLLALGRLARNNLDVHVQVMQILVSYINANPIVLRSDSPTTKSSPAPFTSSNTRLDVQTAFDVIGDRTADQVEQEKIESAEKPSTAFVIRNALLIGVNLDDKNLSNLKFVDCDFSGAHIGTDLSDTEFVQCDLFHVSGFFLGKAKFVAKCLIKGSSTQLKYALDPYELVNNFVSGSIANLSLEVNLEPPSHWMHEGTPYTVAKDAWEEWLLEHTG